MLSETLLKKLEIVWGIPIFFTKGPGREMRGTGLFARDESPLIANPELAAQLMKAQDARTLPATYRYREKFCFFCIRAEDFYYLSGPFCLQQVSFTEIHKFYKACRLDGVEEVHPRKKSDYEALNFISLLYEMLTGTHVASSELAAANHFADLTDVESEAGRAAIAAMEKKRIEEDIYHHTYKEERRMLDYVREGRVKEALEHSLHLKESTGVMSPDSTRNQQYQVVTAVTLATRAAIEGGVAPAEAYQMSDYLMNEIDKMTKYEEFSEAWTQAVVTFTQMVAGISDTAGTSYTIQAKHYIAQNYYHKIYIREIADEVGVSQGHLSRVFHEDTGMKIQDYILKYRVKRAADLLRYSDMRLAEISAAVCFQSESYFVSVFKKYMGVTPGAYRLKNAGRGEKAADDTE